MQNDRRGTVHTALSERAMRPNGVVVVAPLLDQHFRLLQCVEDFAVQQLVPKLAVEALVVAVFPGAPRIDTDGLNPNLGKPGLEVLCDELRTIV